MMIPKNMIPGIDHHLLDMTVSRVHIQVKSEIQLSLLVHTLTYKYFGTVAVVRDIIVKTHDFSHTWEMSL